MKEFKNAVELLTLCTEKNLPISEIMRQREIILGETTAEDVDARMARVLEIMKDAAFSPVKKPVKSMGGLIGGEAKKLSLHQTSGKSICGNLLDDAITYAMATLETNASMGLIVASPTAGSAESYLDFFWLSRNIIIFLMNRFSRRFLMPVRSVILQ